MDGIFVAYHSTARFFGFQYLPISVMDEALFGTTETGEQVFRLALGTLERVLDEAIKCYPEQSVNVTWAADREADVLRVFVAPQQEVERVESASASTKSETPEEDPSGALDAPEAETAEQLSEMTLLELRDLNKAIEEEFGSDDEPLEISDEDAESIKTVQDAVKYLNDRGIKD